MNLSENFTLEELNCKCPKCKGKVPEKTILSNLTRLANTLEALRHKAGKPVYIDSGYRCKVHNKAVGGAEQSAHLTGEAADWHIKGLTEEQMFELAAGMKHTQIPKAPKWVFSGVGYYKGRNFCHVDISRKKPRPNTWSL